MQAGIQYDRHYLPKAAGLETVAQRLPHPLLRTYFLGRRRLNPLGNFASANRIQVAASNFIRSSNPASRTICEAKADGEAKQMDENEVFIGLGDAETPHESLLEADKLLEIFPNINTLWAFLIVEECCRLGITYFCIAPGSRSSPLAVAAAQNSRASCISCIDERSLAFHALGYGKGSYKPAAVITSSGTALSNLLPAVVEASQDCIPLLLLTADRPPELHDTGANQTINQVNHFGSFVRYFYNLPPPDDKVPARMVLTTIDTAVFRATQEPFGPVHINCGFREPLAGVYCEWNLGSLKGLNMWMSKREPFTKHIRVTQFHFTEELMNTHVQYKEVVDLIQGASRGLLILGGLQTAEETWAALSLAKHLRWPVVPDILSGMRVRKITCAIAEAEFSPCFIDLLDHILLGNSVKNWISPDVVVQVGSKVTSKRVAQLLEDCRPHAYMMVQNHPYRHDPSHILTHRIQASVVDFATVIREFCTPKEMGSWCKWLQVLNNMVEWEISFQLNVEPLLTEPYVSRAVSQSLSLESAWFLGNSMAIRDADMYALSWSKLPEGLTIHGLDRALPFSGLRVVGNRGASGIDGVLSTAIGYATGSNQRVVFMVGDISFIHDTNGLTLLQERAERPPITVLVINNHGGAIFSLLPIADTAPATIFRNFFSTPHDVSISNLCLAHRVKHMLVQTKQELESALLMSQEGQLDWVIEIESHIEDNTAYHRVLQQSARDAVNHAFKILSNYSQSTNLESDTSQFSVLKLEYSRYRIPLNAPDTAISEKNHTQEAYREGFILTLFLDNGKRGFGEVAPIGPQNEDLMDVEEQLRFLVHRACNMSLNYLICLLNNSFSGWIWRDIGIPACSLFPSVRCGLEMAVLSALAATRDCNIADLLLATDKTQNVPSSEAETGAGKVPSRVQICALLDSDGPPEEVACAAEKLVEQGFHTIKLKVARRSGPLEDVAVIQAVRQKIGNLIEIRADANRKWTFSQAMQFASHVKDCNLQYIEEPVKFPEEILRFCKESDLFIALDETIDDIADQPLDRLSIFAHPKVVATVIKPSRIGGFERAALIAKWAQKHGMMVVVSAAFESSVSLAVYAQFAYYVDNKNLEAVRESGKQDTAVVSHGLGTYSWLCDDIMKKRLQFRVYPKCDRIEVDVDDATSILQNIEVNPDTVKPTCVEAKINTYTIIVNYKETCFSFHVMDTGINNQNGDIQDKTVLFFHGFLGTSNDWLPIMQSLSVSARCISIDLPGHGKTHVQQNPTIQNDGNAQSIAFAIDDQGIKEDQNFSIEVLAKVLCGLICQITHEKVVLVGYSMGARVALYMALKFNKQIAAAALISGSPGLQDPFLRMSRSEQDDALAESLLSGGLHSFVEMWYKREMWESLRSHPYFKKIRQGRIQHDNIKELAKALISLSIGRQPSLWHELSGCERPLLVIAGKKDSKFKKIAQQMYNCKVDQPKHEKKRTDHMEQITMLEVDDSGHAVHIENPLPVINAIRKFVTRSLITVQT